MDPFAADEMTALQRHGQFDAARFDEVLARYGRPDVDGLSESDITTMIEDILLPGTVQRSSSQLAFRLLKTIAGEPMPSGELAITRARLRAFYEGDLLPSLVAAHAGVTNVEPISRTLRGVAVGAIRAVCPFIART